MSYKIICPYCFNSANGGKPVSDEDVMFRSERVNHGEPEFIPDEYDTIEDFSHRYTGSDKDELLRRYNDWNFFAEEADPVYENFWAKFDGTTEVNPTDDFLQVKAQNRRVIDPKDPYHQYYLKKQADGGFFIRDAQGMVTQIELTTGEKCHRRVCRFCHNPLPENYGKNPVKFAAIIGITGAGKTVFLAQLLKYMKQYVAKVGLNAVVSNVSVRIFSEKNKVEANEPLPGSTPKQKLQQPLFYELVKDGTPIRIEP